MSPSATAVPAPTRTDPDAAVKQVTYLVLAKAPAPGAVKTRLTPAYSEHEAAALAAAALLDTLTAVTAAAGALEPDSPPPVCALLGDPASGAAPAALATALESFTVIGQRGEGLASRLAHAHVDAAGEFGATVQIGMDTPQVSPALLSAAAELVTAQDGPDAALGLAQDGGWWVLALRRAGHARLIADVAMSTAETGRLTHAALSGGGLRVELLPPLLDVDLPEDVATVAAAATGTRFAALAGTLGDRTER